MGKGTLLFTASACELKITSISKVLTHYAQGTCELYEVKLGNYEWFILNPPLKRSFKFKTDKSVGITTKSRDGGQFQIIVKDTKDTTQLTGKLVDAAKCRSLISIIDNIKNKTPGLPARSNQWLSATKENIGN